MLFAPSPAGVSVTFLVALYGSQEYQLAPPSLLNCICTMLPTLELAERVRVAAALLVAGAPPSIRMVPVGARVARVMFAVAGAEILPLRSEKRTETLFRPSPAGVRVTFLVVA